MLTVTLKPGRDKNARQRHPWIFSGAVARADKGIAPGEIVRVLDGQGRFVAYGYYNAASQIRLRLLEWNEKVEIDDRWWETKISESLKRRKPLSNNPETDSYRLVYGESDLLPGLIVDKYSDYLVVQVLTAGIERFREQIISILQKLAAPLGIFERSDADIRHLEGLKPSTRLLAGAVPEHVTITENGHKFTIDIKSGQKSGFYLDQRDNRQTIAGYANGCHLLDCFSYSGAFSVYALAAKAESATLVDSSSQSLAQARENFRLNGIADTKAELIDGDVFKILRDFRASGRKFDFVILDPPKFAPTKSDLTRALAAYKDINMLGLSLLRPNGLLATFSCSGAVDPQTLQTVLFWAAGDIGRPVQILRSLSQGLDHPRLVTFPESEYLKGFICRVIS